MKIRGDQSPDVAHDPDGARRLLVAWEDPSEALREGLAMPGLAYMQAMAVGELPMPPLCRVLGLVVVEAEEGRVVMAAVPDERHLNSLGIVHGALALALLDSCLGCAVHTLLDASSTYVTLELKTNFVRAIDVHAGALRAEGTIVHPGRRVATAEGRVLGGDGRLVAHSSCTCLISAKT
jgi:uncharacterized protein (TIGR00369 family)